MTRDRLFTAWRLRQALVIAALASVLLGFWRVGCLEISQVSDSVHSSILKALEVCFNELEDGKSLPVERVGVVYQVQRKRERYSAKILVYRPMDDAAGQNGVLEGQSFLSSCISKHYAAEVERMTGSVPGLFCSTDIKYADALSSEEELEEVEKRDKNGALVIIRRRFMFNIVQSEDTSTAEDAAPTSTSTPTPASGGACTSSPDCQKDVNALRFDESFHPSSLCRELTPEEVVDAIKFQNAFMLPDIIYLEVSVLLRRLAKRIDLHRSAEETLSIVMPGIGGLLVSDIHCEESLRVSLVAGELTIPGVGPNEFPAICHRLQQCLADQTFHSSALIGLSKAKKYVEFVLKRNRNFMWETLNKMVGILGNVGGLKTYQLWLEMEILIKNTTPGEDVLHSDLPKEVILLADLVKNSKSQVVECTISLMKIGASYDIRLSQTSEVARICNRVFSSSPSYLSADEMRLISDTTILSRIADWMVGTFILEKHIPPGVTKPAACMYLSAITSPMDYSSITNFLWPRIVFAISSSSASALSFSTRSVDPENCRKSLSKVLRLMGDKIQINIDETCGKMAGCVLNGRIGRVSVDDTISNALNQSQQTINYDVGTNSASLRVARFIFESKAPLKSKRNGFSKLSAPLRGSVLFGHLQAIMPGGFSVNDVVKFVHSFTKESPPNGPAKKCFKELIKYIPVFASSDNELKTICVNAFGPWIMPDILVSDVTFSQSTVHNDIIV